MKKLILGLVVLLSLITSVFATEVNTDWLGGGRISQTVTADDDATVSFVSDGDGIGGNLNVNDANNNPYNYGVDTVTAYSTSAVNNGFTQFQIDRLASKSSYGNAGQGMYSFVSASNGVAELATGATTNYASMVVSTYGKTKTSNGKNLEANADSFVLQQEIWDGSGDVAFIRHTGTGTSKIDAMSHEMSGSSFKFGKGAGCYTNADIDATGAGLVQVYAIADNGLNVDSGSVVIPGDGNDNSAMYNLQIGYSGHFVFNNFALDGN